MFKAVIWIVRTVRIALRVRTMSKLWTGIKEDFTYTIAHPIEIIVPVRDIENMLGINNKPANAPAEQERDRPKRKTVHVNVYLIMTALGYETGFFRSQAQLRYPIRDTVTLTTVLAYHLPLLYQRTLVGADPNTRLQFSGVCRVLFDHMASADNVVLDPPWASSVATATEENFLASIRSAVAAAQRSDQAQVDVVLLYFSGHGTTNGSLRLFNPGRFIDTNTSVTPAAWQGAAANFPYALKNFTAFFNSCYSGNSLQQFPGIGLAVCGNETATDLDGAAEMAFLPTLAASGTYATLLNTVTGLVGDVQHPCLNPAGMASSTRVVLSPFLPRISQDP